MIRSISGGWACAQPIAAKRRRSFMRSTYGLIRRGSRGEGSSSKVLNAHDVAAGAAPGDRQVLAVRQPRKVEDQPGGEIRHLLPSAPSDGLPPAVRTPFPLVPEPHAL